MFKFRVTLFKKKLYRILEFKQESFLKPYIERNTEFRKETEKEGNKIKKQNAKLRSSAISGKSIENPMNNVDAKILTTRRQNN